MVHRSFKFWFSLLHKCHITGGYVTCSLFIHNRNNDILLLLLNFRIKTKGVHLLVAQRKCLPHSHHRTPTPLSDQLGSPKFELFRSIKVTDSKKVLGWSQHMWYIYWGLYYLSIDVVISLLTEVLTEHRWVIDVHICIYYCMHIKLTRLILVLL